MKILHVVPSYLPAWRYGGPIRSVHGLAKNLVSRGHEVHVYTTNIDGPTILDVPINSPVIIDGVVVYYFPCDSVFKRLYVSKAMKSMAMRDVPKFDVIHLHSVFLWPTWMIGKLAIKYKVPYILSPRGMLVNSLIRKKNTLIKILWIYFLEIKTIANAKYIHFTTKLEYNEFTNLKLRSNGYLIIPNGYDFDDEAEHQSERLNYIQNFTNPYIIFIGRVNWKKGLDRLILAMELLSDYQLLVVGNDDGALENLTKQSIKLGLENRIHFLGEVRGKSKKDLIKKSKMLVLPSYSENFGNVLLEAIALGKPVAFSKDVGLANELLVNGAGVLLPDDPIEMGIKLVETLGDEKLLNNMGIAGAKFAMTFSWDIIAKNFETAYQAPN